MKTFNPDMIHEKIKNHFKEILKDDSDTILDIDQIVDVTNIDYIKVMLVNFALFKNTILNKVKLPEVFINDFNFMIELYKCGNYKFNYKYVPTTTRNSHIVKYLFF